jgi:hypothetical protein
MRLRLLAIGAAFALLIAIDLTSTARSAEPACAFDVTTNRVTPGPAPPAEVRFDVRTTGCPATDGAYSFRLLIKDAETGSSSEWQLERGWSASHVATFSLNEAISLKSTESIEKVFDLKMVKCTCIG